jgi:hypothetical protein
MSAASLREAIIAQMGHVHDATGRAYRTAYAWGDGATPTNPATWSAGYTDPKAFAECIADAIEPEIQNRVDLNVKERFDPTAALPASPTVGDVYLATATAHGWTAGNLYTWNGATYDVTVPCAGMQIWIVATGTASISTGIEWVDLEASSGSLSGTVSPNTLAMGGPLGSGLVDSPIVSDIAAHGKLWIGYNFVGAGAGPIYNGDLCLNFCPENGYGVAFTWADAESFRIQSDLSVLINNGNWLEFGELNHYIRNKQNGTTLANSDLEIGSSYGNTVFLAGGGCYTASECLRVGEQFFGLSGDGYGIQAPGIWSTGLASKVVKTDANGKLVGCTNLADVAYLTTVTPHNILSTTHGDTLADTVVRGDLLTGNATPKWGRLAKGTSGNLLGYNATDVVSNTLAGWGIQATLTNPVTGTGAQYYVPLWGAGGTRLGNSILQQDAAGTTIGIGGVPDDAFTAKFYGDALYLGHNTKYGLIPLVLGFSYNQYPAITYNCQFQVGPPAGYKYYGNDYASMIMANYDYGSLQPVAWNFRSAPNGTAGNAISWTTVANLFNNGNFWIYGSDVNGMGFSVVNAAATTGASQQGLIYQLGSTGYSIADWPSAFLIEGQAAGGTTIDAFSGALSLQTARVTRLKISNAGSITIPGLSSAGILCNATTTGLISSHACGNTLLQIGNSSGQLADCGTVVSNTYAMYSGGVLTLYNSTASSEGVRVNTNGTANGSTSIDARATGAGTTNTALYADAENAGTNWGLYVNAGNAQFNGLVGIGGAPSMSSGIDIYANVTSSNLLYIKNNNTLYGSIITFPMGYIGDWGSAASAWSGAYGNIAPASKTGLVGSTTGLFLTTMGGNIQFATHGQTTVALEIADGSITVRQSFSIANLSVAGVVQNSVTTGTLTSHVCGNGYAQMGNSSGQLADMVIRQAGTDIGIGTTSPQTTLSVNGSLSTKTPVVSGTNYTSGSPYVITTTDYTVIFTNASADQYVTMPSVSTAAGRIICLQAMGQGGFNLIMTNGNLFMPPGGTTPTNIILNTNNYTTCILHSDGTYWRTLSRS